MTAVRLRKGAEADRAEIKKWVQRLLADFVERIPAGVKFSAVMQLDESHVHLHILAVNIADPKLSANKLHVGKRAAEQWRAAHGAAQTIAPLPRPVLEARPLKPKRPKPSKNRVTLAKRAASYAEALADWAALCAEVERRNAEALAVWTRENDQHLHQERKKHPRDNLEKAVYRTAMASFQDRYFDAVGKPCGLLRHGPRNERLSTRQYAERKAHARQAARVEAAQQRLVLLNRKKSDSLEHKEHEQRREARRLEAQDAALNAKGDAQTLKQRS